VADWTRLSEDDCDLAAFRAQVERETDGRDYPHAETVEGNVLIYEANRVRELRGEARREFESEFVRALTEGPGVAVFRGAFDDESALDRMSAVFGSLIEEERETGMGCGDHFAKPGANDRIWNALEKTATRDPEVFADYYSNEILATVCKAWLGPGYQVTSQVNVVNPGGEAQSPHRDYHLGFLSNRQAAAFPRHVHRLSPVLTLQGAVAHCDMPKASGPTEYLPYSQRYEAGYLAWRRPEFRAYFEQNRVQLPLNKGDAVFFNPAVFHSAGANRTSDVRRTANLLQVSSALGRAMETVDRRRMVQAVYPVLQRMKSEGVPESRLQNVIAACAEGYPFPTKLDENPPVDGLAPASEAEMVWLALEEGCPSEELARRLGRRGRAC